MTLFIVTVFFALITPGPGVLTTAGVGSNFGFRPGLTFLVGLFIGTNLVAVAVVTGLWASVAALPTARLILASVSIAYLLYLALKIAFAGSKVAFINPSKAPGLLHGIALQIINPKAYVVNTTLFSSFNFLPQALFTEYALKFLFINMIWIPVHIIWLGFGIWLRELNLAPGVTRAINFAMAAAMLCVVGLAAYGAFLAGG